jgi:hypothetical protein
LSRSGAGHPRLKTDEAIKKVGEAGSVMGITGVRMFVKGDDQRRSNTLLDHFDYVRKLIGPEHLGVGSDMDLYGYDAMPAELNKQLRAAYKGSYAFREKIDIEGLNHPKRMFDLTEGLIRRKIHRSPISKEFLAAILNVCSRRFGLSNLLSAVSERETGTTEDKYISGVMIVKKTISLVIIALLLGLWRNGPSPQKTPLTSKEAPQPATAEHPPTAFLK